MIDLAKPEMENLRGRFLKAYSDSSHREFPISKVKKNFENSYIKLLYADMRRVFGLPLDAPVIAFGTLAKLLFSDNAESFRPDVHEIFENYIFLVNESNKFNPFSETLKGVDVIDDRFKSEVIKHYSIVEKIDFYTSKLVYKCQWGGIFSGLDLERSIYANLKIAVLQCFKKSSKICAVVTGLSGSGKTTILRRLAADFINHEFEILWLTSLSQFNHQIQQLDINTNYLLIIDDWNTIENNPKSKNDFFDALSSTNNIRVVIGDYHCERDYLNYLYGENIFPLSSGDNQRIILDIVENIPEWKTIAEKCINNKEILTAPLFLLLFIIARLSPQQPDKFFDTDDLISQFFKIVKNDQLFLHDKNKGLAKAIYYWACIYIEYDVSITLEALSKLADYYNVDQKDTNKFLPFNLKNRVCEILSHYISFKEMVHPAYEGLHEISFHHDLLVEALTKTSSGGWYFDIDVKLEVIQILVDQKELAIATDLYWANTRKEKYDKTNKIPGMIVFHYGKPHYDNFHFKNADQRTYFDTNLCWISQSFTSDLQANSLLENKYLKNSIPTEEDGLRFIKEIEFLFCRYQDTGCYYKIFSKMLTLGNESLPLRYAKDLSYVGHANSDLLSEVMQYLFYDPKSEFYNTTPTLDNKYDL